MVVESKKKGFRNLAIKNNDLEKEVRKHIQRETYATEMKDQFVNMHSKRGSTVDMQKIVEKGRQTNYNVTKQSGQGMMPMIAPRYQFAEERRASQGNPQSSIYLAKSGIVARTIKATSRSPFDRGLSKTVQTSTNCGVINKKFEPVTTQRSLRGGYYTNNGQIGKIIENIKTI